MLKIAPVAFACMLSGCAHAPDAAIGYRLAQTEVRFKVVQTVSCTKDFHPIVVTSVTPATRHFADENKAYAFSLRSIQGLFSDTDTKFAFYDDRRISSINASNTGNGAHVLATALSVAGGVLAFDGGDMQDTCGRIAAAGNNKPLTLVYEGIVATDGPGAQDIAPDPASAAYLQDDAIRGLVHGICAVVEETRAGLIPVTGTTNAGAYLTAREPGVANIRIAAGSKDACGATALWRGSIAVAQLGKIYQLPIPHAAVFGKQTFAASFDEAGALSMVQYGASGSAAAGEDAAEALTGSTKRATTAQQAAELKAQADLIFQQQRLLSCQADKTACQ